MRRSWLRRKTSVILQDRDILGLDTLPNGSEGDLSVVVSYKDGTVEIIAANMTASLEERTPSTEVQSDYEVESATILHVDTARKSVF